MSLSTRSRPDELSTPGSPPASRAARSGWRDARLVVGLALVAVTTLLGAAVLGDRDTTAVWAARSALAEGQAVEAEDLVAREVRFVDAEDAVRYVAATGPVPDGVTLTRDVGAGELLPAGALGEGDEALLEVPLVVAAEALPATVRAGSVVDVWVTPDPDLAAADSPEGTSAALVFSAVRVVAVSRPGGGLGPAATRQVIIGLEPGSGGILPRALGELARGSVVLVRTP